MSETVAKDKAEKTTAEKTEKKEKKAKKTETAETDLTPHEQISRQKKASRWTLEVCKKKASRYDSREAWATGAPASYKAAVAHGWEADCLKGMKKPEGKTTTTPARKAPTRAA